MIKKHILLFLFLWINLYAIGQQYYFRNISINEGLPQSTVYCTIQDSRGYIWMGTDGGGLCKYDGRDIEVFNKSNGLTGNIVRSLFEDSKGNIWIGTDKGITIYDGYQLIPIEEDNGYQASFTLKIFESPNGTIWAATNDAGLYKIIYSDSIQVKNFGLAEGLVNNFIFDINEDSKGRLWLAMIGGINILEFNESNLNVTKLIKERDLPTDFITCIEKLDDESFAFGTYGFGAFKITNTSNSKDFKVVNYEDNVIPNTSTIWDITSVNNDLWFSTDAEGAICLRDGKQKLQFNKENGFETNQIMGTMEDSEGNLWFSTMESGVYIYLDDKLLSYGINQGLPDNNVNALFYDENELLAGTNDGLVKFEIHNNSLIKKQLFNEKPGLSSSRINAVIKDKNEKIWVGTNNGIDIISNSGIKNIDSEDGLSSDKIYCLFEDSNGIIWAGSDNGYNKIENGVINTFTQDQGFINSEVQCIMEDSEHRIWMGTLGGLVKIEGKTYTDYNEEEGLNNLRIHSLAEDHLGNLWIGTFGGGIYKFDHTRSEMPIEKVADKKLISSNNIYALTFLNDTVLIVGTEAGFDYLVLDKLLNPKKAIHYGPDDGFSGNEVNLNAFAKDNKGYIWFGTINGIIRFDPGYLSKETYPPTTFITNLKLFFEDIKWEERETQTKKWFNTPEKLVLSHNENHLTFDFSGIYYKDPKDLEYSYFLEGQSKSWSPYSKKNEIIFQGLSHGDYTLKVQSKNKYGNTGLSDSISFTIKPPFYKTWWFISSITALVIFLIIIYIRYRESKLKKDKIKLEKTVQERTREIVEQKNEIEKQKDIVTIQKQEITDSIQYAQTIQKAVLPKEQLLEKAFSDYFILFRPKDIVSGDFYWISDKDDKIIFTAADCTGHGVPGAFMSMLGVSYLNRIVNELGITQPDLILNKLRSSIIDALQQRGLPEENKDGMDISICSFDPGTRILQFAGANNSIVFISKNNGQFTLEEVKADRMPVAIYSKMNDFTLKEIKVEKGDTIYLFSDGYIDQFGGPKGKKFMKKNFKELLLEHQNKDMISQKEVLIESLEKWIKHDNQPFEQIDDIIVMGVKI